MEETCNNFHRHARDRPWAEARASMPSSFAYAKTWMPAFAGMTQVKMIRRIAS